MTDAKKLAAVIKMEFEHEIDGERATIPTDVFYLLRESAKELLSTLPRTKEVEVWHVEYVEGCIKVMTCSYPRQAEERAESMRRGGAQCVRVTGPHKHIVPA